MCRLPLSRELTIRALESERHTFNNDSLLHHISYHFGIVKDAQGHAFKVTSFLSLDIVDHTSCVACTISTHVRDISFTDDCHISMLHDIYTLCVASNSWTTCYYHMVGCTNIISSHMPCPFACHMIHLIASHMMNNCSFYCVECHSFFTTPYARYAWIVLHMTHVFRYIILFGVVNNFYAYHRPFIEQFVNARYELEVDASSLVTHICITTSHLHACSHDDFH